MITQSTMPATHKRSVLLVDDHPIVRQGLSQLVNQQSDLQVHTQAANAKEALEAMEKGSPDIAIVDIALEDRSGVELIKELHSRDPNLPILALSMHDESLYAERALRAGAKGYIMKQEATEQVMTAIRKVLDGEIYLSAKMAAHLANLSSKTSPSQPAAGLQRLTDRELEIFGMIGQGLGTREVANKLQLSIKTIEAHREHIKEKLKLRSGTELMRLAVQHALELPKER